MPDIISFVMTVYNTRIEWIERAVNSIINQTNKNWELIIVDDGSKEDIAQFCDDMSERSDQIKVYHQDNAGVCVARNYGTDHAAGRWITYIDSDDWIEETYVEQINAVLKEHDYIDLLAIGHDDIWDENVIEHFWGKEDYHEFDNGEKEGMQLALMQAPEWLKSYPMFFGAQWKIVYALSFLNRHGVRNVSGLKKSEDAIFNLYAVEYAEKIGYYNKVLYHYFHNNESVTGKKYNNDLDRYIKLLKAYRKFIEETGKENIEKYNYAYKNMALIVFEGMLRSYFLNEDNYDGINVRRKQMIGLLSSEPYNYLMLNERTEGMSLYKKILFGAMKTRNYNIICDVYKLKSIIKRNRN